jgi:hypothetical protein
MSEKITFVISKDIAEKCVVFLPPIHFVNDREAKATEGRKSYSSVVHHLIKEKYRETLFVGNGKKIGENLVTIYLKCSHGCRFNAQTYRKNFVKDVDIEFEVIRKTQIQECRCCKSSHMIRGIIFIKLLKL